MTRKNFSGGLLAGLLVGTLLTVLLSGRYVTPRAFAQDKNPQPNAMTQRFQIAAWAYPSGTGFPAAHGAYILDTQTGKVWQVIEQRTPEPIGSVK